MTHRAGYASCTQTAIEMCFPDRGRGDSKHLPKKGYSWPNMSVSGNFTGFSARCPGLGSKCSPIQHTAQKKIHKNGPTSLTDCWLNTLPGAELVPPPQPQSPIPLQQALCLNTLFAQIFCKAPKSPDRTVLTVEQLLMADS